MGVSNIFYFHPYFGKWSNLTNIFQRGWNHQPVLLMEHSIATSCRIFFWSTVWLQVGELFEFRRLCSFKVTVAQSSKPIGIQAENTLLLMLFPVEHREFSIRYASLLVSKKGNKFEKVPTNTGCFNARNIWVDFRRSLHPHLNFSLWWLSQVMRPNMECRTKICRCLNEIERSTYLKNIGTYHNGA